MANKWNIQQTFRQNKRFILFIVLMCFFRSAVADWYTVPTGSMKPTIEEGDRLTVNKMAYDLRLPFTDVSIFRTGEPQRGDIMVFESEAADIRLIKRVIGLPGDTVAMKNNLVSINGHQLSYQLSADKKDAVFLTEQLNSITYPTRFSKDKTSGLNNFNAITIPHDYYLVLGDNRLNSADSRVYGLVPRSEIRGKAHYVVFSHDYDNYHLPKADRWIKSLY